MSSSTDAVTVYKCSTKRFKTTPIHRQRVYTYCIQRIYIYIILYVHIYIYMYIYTSEYFEALDEPTKYAAWINLPHT